MSHPAYLSANTLSLPGLRHGYFMRRGGVCQGLQDGRVNDLSAGFSPTADTDAIRENRKRIEYEFGAPFVSARQVHGAEVLTVTDLWDAADKPREADGLVTNMRHLGLGILTADCGPILFADMEAGVVGACHAGWRGLKAGVVEATLAAMINLGARRDKTIAALGPCLSRASYEVSLDYPSNFAGMLKHHRSYFRASVKRDKLLFDFPRAIRTKLEEAGIKRPEIMDRCTFVDRDNFFSFRRATHNQEPDYGRQISLIALK